VSNWQKVKLDCICEKKIKTISSKDDFFIDYIDISSIDNQEKKVTTYQTLSSVKAPSRAKQILEKGDILVSTVRPNLNAVAINNLESENIVVGSTGFCVLRCTKEADVNYVFNYCKSKEFIEGLVKIAKGASYPAVSNTEVRNSLIPLPPIEEQVHISKSLDKADELLTMHKQRLTELNNLIKSTFYDIFGDPVINDKGWTEIALNDLLEDIKYGTSTPPLYSESGYRFIRATNIKAGRINENGVKYISDIEATKISKCKLKIGDLIIVRSGVNTGDTCMITREYDGQYAGYDLIITPKQSKIDSAYLNELLNTKYMEIVVKPLTRRAAQPHLNAEQIKQLRIILPPIEIQNKFATIVTKIEEQKALVKKAIDETQLLFNSLMSQYFD
jgi:type I restriction enzyme S subunit